MWKYQGKEYSKRAAKPKMERRMQEMGLKEDKTTNRAAWRNTIISYTGDPRYTGQAREEED